MDVRVGPQRRLNSEELIDALELWCWIRLLRVPWTARRSNQSILKEINPEYSLKILMLKLKLQYFGHLMWRADSLEKTLMLGKTKGKKRRGLPRMRWLDGIIDSIGYESEQISGDSRGEDAWHAAAHWVTKSRTGLREWTKTKHGQNAEKLLIFFRVSKIRKEAIKKTRGSTNSKRPWFQEWETWMEDFHTMKTLAMLLRACRSGTQANSRASPCKQ